MEEEASSCQGQLLSGSSASADKAAVVEAARNTVRDVRVSADAAAAEAVASAELSSGELDDVVKGDILDEPLLRV